MRDQTLLKYVALDYKIPCTQYFSRIRELGHAVLLDSGFTQCQRGRYDIISAAPSARLSFNNEQLMGENLAFNIDDISDPFHAASLLLMMYQELDAKNYVFAEYPDKEIPFCGGLLGHFSYDLGRCIEEMPQHAEDDTLLPQMHLGLYGWAIIIDHQQQDCYLMLNTSLPNPDIDDLVKIIQTAAPDSCDNFELSSSFSSNLDKDQYAQALTKINDYILSGDCYQVNFAQRFSANFQGDPFNAYLKLRSVAPTHFSAFIDTEHGAILSLSPERFLSVDKQGHVLTQPIKGTQPRSNNTEQDQKNKDYLINSEKDRSENVMIVDLMRNDLSKVCELHSVKVPALFSIESYRNVHHLVSTVSGKLEQGKSAIDLLKGCFPGGSITGAPKIRAMQIIDELEPHRRSIYCGSIGYISLCGAMDTSITIRTLLAQNNTMHCWAGGGIVADSEIADEYQETFDKVNNLLDALQTSDRQ